MVITMVTKRSCNALILHEVQINLHNYSVVMYFISCVFTRGNNIVHGLFVIIMPNGDHECQSKLCKMCLNVYQNVPK